MDQEGIVLWKNKIKTNSICLRPCIYLEKYAWTKKTNIWTETYHNLPEERVKKSEQIG